MSNTWSPKLVEELLFRQYIKGEDVSMLLPPPPSASVDQYMNDYEQSTKILFSYVRNGPTNALASQSVNNPRGCAGTPLKGHPSTQRAGNQGQGACAASSASTGDTKGQFLRSPKGPDNSPTTPAAPHSHTGWDNVAPHEAMGPPDLATKKRVVWPSHVPTDASLKSQSRSKVAHLTARRVAAQETVDPDLIFMQNPEELPLHAIFAKYPKALDSLVALRGASGDWREDTFTSDEEKTYKRELGFVHIGPSQCAHSQSNVLQK
uniref:Chromosomal passenger protein n=1 Tax=Trypanosoma congolense (strain IL3000) TaxID=1068625 RepID=G0UP63_TRYCI|nr:conserved hypothetical protein [Trypanosoma congolense IL3000]